MPHFLRDQHALLIQLVSQPRPEHTDTTNRLARFFDRARSVHSCQLVVRGRSMCREGPLSQGCRQIEFAAGEPNLNESETWLHWPGAEL